MNSNLKKFRNIYIVAISVSLIFLLNGCFFSYREAATREDFRHFVEVGAQSEIPTKELRVNGRELYIANKIPLPALTTNLRLTNDFNLGLTALVAPPYAGGGGIEPRLNLLEEKYNKPALMMYGNIHMYHAKIPADTVNSMDVNQLRAGLIIGKTIHNTSFNIGYHGYLESRKQKDSYLDETWIVQGFCSSHGPDIYIGLKPWGRYRFCFNGEYNYQMWSLKNMNPSMTYSHRENRSDFKFGISLQIRLGSVY
ncbi:MAG: hypothetical protein JXA60_12885 [Candidatus Coatesbacteria bacterium]|nr:hypothetical protein [Candidatus Coatesbacteria bacterium]